MIDRLAAIARLQPAVAFVAAWAALVVFITPLGEFSINDDWAYTFSVRWFLETGEVRLTFWHAMTLVAQLAMGVGWASVFGTSELAFRLFSAALAAAGLAGFFRLIVVSGGARAGAAAATACLLAFPIFQASALTFMTDTPHLAVSILAALAFAHALKRREVWSVPFVLGLVLLVVALLTRQTAAALAVGFAAADMFAHGFARKTLHRSGIVLAMTILVLAAYAPLMDHAGLLPAGYGLRFADMRALAEAALRFDIRAIEPMTVALVQGARLFGVLAAPLALAILVDKARAGKRSLRFFLVAAGLAAPILAASISGHFALVTLASSVLGADGIGPRDPPPASFNLPLTPFYVGLTFVGCGAFGVIAADLLLRAREVARRSLADRRAAAPAAMAAIVAAASFAPFGLTRGVFFDRYVLYSGAFALAALAMTAPHWSALLARRRVVVIAAFGAATLASAILVHDFFAWSRARHQLIADFVQRTGVDPGEIDGGLEHNNRLQLERRPLESMTLAIADAPRRFVVAKRPYPGRTVVAARRAGQILPLYGDTVYILRRP